MDRSRQTKRIWEDKIKIRRRQRKIWENIVGKIMERKGMNFSEAKVLARNERIVKCLCFISKWTSTDRVY